MCGICGLISLDEPLRRDERKHLSEMNQVLRHRGPDGQGLHWENRFGLGSTRLKILDMSEQASMPMGNDDGSVLITYNGEVTNFRELSREFHLEQHFRLRSTSDTEVVLRLYELLGLDFLRHLSGMFAFALVDKRIGKAYIVRDFYGIRPLFYLHDEGRRLYFSSEIKSFLDLPCFNSRVDHEAIFHFLSLAYIPDRLTPFEQIRELQGGWLLEVDLETGRVDEREYYQVTFETDYDLDEDYGRTRLRDEMVASVERNLISDAPLGMTLSGGFDTSSMLGIIRHLGRSRDLHTFSIKIDEPSFDESRYQHLMAEYGGTQHHEVVVNPENVMDTFLHHMAYLDEPSGDGAAIPTWLLAEAAKPHVSVLLSGEGGDEAFNAYETHLAWKVRRVYRQVPGPLRSIIRGLVSSLPTDYRKLSFDFVARRFTQGAELDVPDAHFFWRHSLSGEEKRAIMPGHHHYMPTERFFSDLYHSLDWAEELNRLSLLDLKYFFIGDLMVKNDRMMMAHSVEARFPWMDRILMDFASTVPPNLRIRGFSRRYLQKQAMKEFVPEEIFRRTNMGLEMPHSLWFMDAMRPLVERHLTRDRVESTGFLSFEPLWRMWEEHRAHRKDHGRSLWCVLNLLAWHELFVEERSYKRYYG